MRVVSGKYRGRKLLSPPGEHTRPTLDRIKENLYNLLGPVEGFRVLDLFAGSGGLGIEALSRGASEVVFCDNDPEAVRFLKRNLERMGEQYRILESDFVHCLRTVERGFDLILLDPPYHGDCYERALSEIVRLKLLGPEGILTVETDADFDFDALGFVVWKERRYGAVRLFLLKEKTTE